ncbi:MAG: 50S ribosomal protein L10 [Clostridia bacterium]|nr:50S ribosomal protein L10 [Clostridia bacterium]
MASQGILELKRAQVDAIKEKIANAKGLVIVDYIGLTVDQDTAYRKGLRDNGLEYAVIKNRFLQRAFHELGYNDFDEALNGTTAVAFSYSDCIAPAKSMAEAAKLYSKIKIKCGMAEGKFIDAAGVSTVAAFISKEALISKMLGTMQSPITNFAVVLNQIAEKQAQA